LKDAGIELKGKIALANYGGIYRGTKVKNAQDNGMVGAVIYTDPMDDGEVREENGYEAYPSTFYTVCSSTSTNNLHRRTGAKSVLNPAWQCQVLVPLFRRPNYCRMGFL
jgi:hypothetical protein